MSAKYGGFIDLRLCCRITAQISMERIIRKNNRMTMSLDFLFFKVVLKFLEKFHILGITCIFALVSYLMNVNLTHFCIINYQV